MSYTKEALMDLVQNAEHPLGCARNVDDYECTCGMLENLCETCGYDLTSDHPGYLHTCPECTKEKA